MTLHGWPRAWALLSVLAVAACDGGPGPEGFDGDADADADGGPRLEDAGDGGDGSADADSQAEPLEPPGDLFGLVTSEGYELQWVDTNDEEDSYVIERRGPGEAGFSPLATVDPDGTTYTDTSFERDRRPVYRVLAGRGADRSEPALCDSAIRTWTYIRIVGFDSLWGEEGPDRATVLGHATELGGGDLENVNRALVGDFYGDEGSIWAHVTPDGIEVEDRPEMNTGDPESFLEFVEWVTTELPGQRYAISFWSHGSGALTYTGEGSRGEAKSIGFDDTSVDELSAEETAELVGLVTERTGRPVEVFFVCACLTGMVEDAYALRGRVRYLVAGESVVGCWGDLLEQVGAHPGWDARALAEANTADQASPEYPKDAVYAATSVDEVSELAARLDTLALALATFAAGGEGADELLEIAGEAQDMNYVPAYPNDTSSYLDLHDLASRLAELDDEPVARAAEAVVEQLDERVIVAVMRQADDQGLYPDAHGLSIYHPTAEYPGIHRSYAALSFAADTAWDEYLSLLFP